MKITSPAFNEGGLIPQKFTCDGENASPPLKFKDVSSTAQSLVLIMDDPDAPSGTWIHWLVWNISPQTKSINHTLPDKAIIGKNSSGENRYAGPCPPGGEHRYFFKLHALDQQLDISPESNKSDLEKAMENHILESAVLMGRYNRNI